ncbi:MAG: hypothetical protein RLY67_628 [Pseudomonadota bacterium]
MQAAGDLFVAVGRTACGKRVGLHAWGDVADSPDIANGLLNDAARAVAGVGVEVKVNFHFTVADGVGQGQVELGHLVDLVHESKLRAVCTLIKISLSRGLTKELATAVAIDVNHDHQGVVCMPDLVLQESAGVGPNVDSCGIRLRRDEPFNGWEVESVEGLHSH